MQSKHNEPPTQLEYFNFYWPLALTGLSMLVARQFQNATLARYPNHVRELAVFALAMSTFFIFQSALIFVPQTVNALARGMQARKKCFRFVLFICILLTIPICLISFSSPGALLLWKVFKISGRELHDVQIYLRYLSPLVLINGLRHYTTGVLVQRKRTGWVTLLNLVFLGGVILILLAGFHLHWKVVETLALAQVISSATHLLLSAAACQKTRTSENDQGEDIEYGDIFRFFWPVSLTSLAFSFTRPIIYFFLARTQEAQFNTAAFRVATDASMLFCNPVNQFRHIFVTYGLEHLRDLRRFVVKTGTVLTAGSILFVATPLSSLYFTKAIGIEPEATGRIRIMMIALCLMPPVMTLRNYFHGLAMARHRTTVMSIGGLLRNVGTLFASWGLCVIGRLDQWTTGLVLVFGFFCEMVVMAIHTRRVNRAQDLGEEE